MRRGGDGRAFWVPIDPEALPEVPEVEAEAEVTPVYYYLRDVQKALGKWKPGTSAEVRKYNRVGERWTARRMERWGILLKRGGRIVTTHELLQTVFPEAASALADEAFGLVAIERRRRR